MSKGSASPPDDREVIVSAESGVGRLRLNRPRAIHALTHGMCVDMAAALADWYADDAVRLVLIDHAASPDGDPKLSRGFCAGGDIRAIWDSGRTDGDAARRFFFDEYRLNHQLFTYAKPVVAFMDGITMGGGVGISQPAKYRIATERTMFAMPETGIGLFPDVGGGWYLSRLPGRTGEYLALTGGRLDGAECVALGLATHYVRAGALDALKADLIARPTEVDALLAQASETPPDAGIDSHRAAIDRLFGGESYETILAALEADGSEWAQKQRAILATKSPQSCKVSLRLVRHGRDHVDFADEMRVEYRVAAHLCQRSDFLEGVRALIVDKDNQPTWNPSTPEGVPDHAIDQIFAPLDPAEEWTPAA
ncbi:enoyl-CoA hydratase/isomerase family protein [Sphingomonas sp. BIUV-7]|uniref:3-hydroxyisobutyryl-CoA hydrolase n=1 Tax=Sphingomonas natans TaxID=3063330 RepID=A0ABT8Y810_9SPHN|nr:enoyl-CoA hydratase/isomerase family protein [Sphingomonas sp. BIUV-7]MDO6414453.1 enoyl-CoA hydratase/isomerase family protein [Sphingomonas sp. BIUV-7]